MSRLLPTFLDFGGGAHSLDFGGGAHFLDWEVKSAWTYSWWSLSFLLGDGVGVPVVYEVVVFGIDTPLQMCTFSYW